MEQWNTGIMKQWVNDDLPFFPSPLVGEGGGEGEEENVWGFSIF